MLQSTLFSAVVIDGLSSPCPARPKLHLFGATNARVSLARYMNDYRDSTPYFTGIVDRLWKVLLPRTRYRYSPRSAFFRYLP